MSVELCGGTHVDHTGEIGPIKVIQEKAVATGIRSIELVAGPALLPHYNQVNILVFTLSL